jgi:L-aminopeptidase/D-esterase-like protein
VARIPIVPAAILFDLGIGRSDVRPDANMGYQACLNATEDPPAEGNVGAGMGATVGKIFGMGQAMKSGLGCAALSIGGGVIVAALAAVNAFGDVLNPKTGEILAGARQPPQSSSDRPVAGFADTLQVMRTLWRGKLLPFRPQESTVIGVIATNARLNKEEANKIAQMAHDGLARTICPAHTMLDGDTIFSLATGQRRADVNVVGAFAAEAFAQAILRAVRTARSAAGLPAASELQW